MIYIVAPVIKRQLRIAAEANAAASSLMVESLTGIQTVKAQHAETTLRWRCSSVMPVSFHPTSEQHL